MDLVEIAGIDISIIVGRPSKNMEDNSKLFILINSNVNIQEKYENMPQEILNIYPNRPRKKTVHFFEIDIDDDKLDLLTDEELKLVKMTW